MLLVICSNTTENFWWELEKINVKSHKVTSYTWNLQNFSCVFTVLVKFDIYFLGLPWEIVFRLPIISIALKNVKKNAILFKLFWYKVFVHWTLKLLNFLMDSLLTSFFFLYELLMIFWSSCKQPPSIILPCSRILSSGQL